MSPALITSRSVLHFTFEGQDSTLPASGLLGSSALPVTIYDIGMDKSRSNQLVFLLPV